MQFAMILSIAVAEFFPTLANPCTQLTIRFFRNRNEKLKKKKKCCRLILALKEMES